MDKNLIEEVIKKEKAQDEFERQQKVQLLNQILYKENLKKYMDNFLKNTRDQKEYEDELERQLKI